MNILENQTVPPLPPVSRPIAIDPSFPDEVARADVDLLERLLGERPHFVLQPRPLLRQRRRSLRHSQEPQGRVARGRRRAATAPALKYSNNRIL